MKDYCLGFPLSGRKPSHELVETFLLEVDITIMYGFKRCHIYSLESQNKKLEFHCAHNMVIVKHNIHVFIMLI